MSRPLDIEPLAALAFAPFGAVIEARGDGVPANQGRARRHDSDTPFHVDAGNGRLGLGVFSAQPAELPFSLDRLERHVLGSQAFVPMNGQRLLVVVATPGAMPSLEGLRAFLTNGRQGVVYHPGTWHHPLIALDGGGDVLVMERRAAGPDCEEWPLPAAVQVGAPA